MILSFVFQYNGSGLSDLGVTSGSQAVRGISHSHTMPAPVSNHSMPQQNGMPASHSMPTSMSTTQPLEAKQLPIELSATLEQIVGQLDILTQVGNGEGWVKG